LEVGLALLQGGHDLLGAAAHSALVEPNSFLRSCRLGPCERGGQIATILVPIPGEPADQREVGRVVPLLLTALQALHGAPTEATDVSVPLCEAMARLAPEDNALRLEIAASWARS